MITLWGQYFKSLLPRENCLPPFLRGASLSKLHRRAVRGAPYFQSQRSSPFVWLRQEMKTSIAMAFPNNLSMLRPVPALLQSCWHPFSPAEWSQSLFTEDSGSLPRLSEPPEGELSITPPQVWALSLPAKVTGFIVPRQLCSKPILC